MDALIGVVAHHTRQHQANALAETVGASYVSVDDGSLGPEANHREVWQWLNNNANGAQFCVVLEDDCVPIDNFRDQLKAVLAQAPTSVVSLYLGRNRPTHWQPRIAQALTRAAQADAHWITTTDLVYGVGVAIRANLVPDMLDATTPHPRIPIDHAIRNWARRNNHTIAFTVPSLLDHRDQPTLVAHPDGQPRAPGRTAWRHGSRNHWNRRTVTLA